MIHKLNSVFIPFPHTTNLQQTTSVTNRQMLGKSIQINVSILIGVEKFVAKEEIAQYCLPCFQKLSTADASSKWETVNPFPHIDAF